MSQYEQLVKALWYCVEGGTYRHCDSCEYKKVKPNLYCLEAILRDAADAIEDLQAEVKQLEPKRGDLVEVVRCKDCRYFYFGFCHNRDGYVKFGAVRDRDWFCADAKKVVQE